MTSKEYRDLMHYSKSDLIGMLETFARSIDEAETAITFYKMAIKQTKKRTEKAEAERDQYRSALECVCVILDGKADETGDEAQDMAFRIALSPFYARGETMEDLRERLYS